LSPNVAIPQLTDPTRTLPIINQPTPKVLPSKLGALLLPYFLYKDIKKEPTIGRAIKKNIPLIGAATGGITGSLLGALGASKMVGLPISSIKEEAFSDEPPIGQLAGIGLGSLLGGILGSKSGSTLSEFVLNKYFPEKEPLKSDIMFI